MALQQYGVCEIQIHNSRIKRVIPLAATGSVNFPSIVLSEIQSCFFATWGGLVGQISFSLYFANSCARTAYGAKYKAGIPWIDYSSIMIIIVAVVYACSCIYCFAS
jgi:hypothetical protein